MRAGSDQIPEPSTRREQNQQVDCWLLGWTRGGEAKALSKGGSTYYCHGRRPERAG